MSNVIDLETERLRRVAGAGQAAHEAGEAFALFAIDEDAVPDVVGLIEHPTHTISIVPPGELVGLALTRDGAHALVRELLVALNTKIPAEG